MPMIVLPALLGAAVAGTIAASAAAGALAFGFSMTAFATSVVLGAAAQALAKRPDAPQTSGGSIAQGRLVTVRQAASPWQWGYGEARVAGDLTYLHQSADKNTLHMILTLYGHEIAEVGDIRFNDDLLAIDSSGGPSGAFAGYAYIGKSLGDESGQPFPDLVDRSEGTWVDSDRQTGRAKIYARLFANEDLYSTGIPNITAVCRQRKVYDPRVGQTIWSDNPALCLADYITNQAAGLSAVYADEIDEDTLIAAANICDERVPLSGATTTCTADASTNQLTIAWDGRIPNIGEGVRLSSSGALPSGISAGVTYYVIHGIAETIKLAATHADARAGSAISLLDAGSGTITLTYYDEPRYTVNGAFRLSEDPQTIISRLLSAMAGTAVQVGRKWWVRAGAYEAPTIELTESDLAGPLHIQVMLSRRDNANAIKGKFVDPSNAWQPTDFPPVISDTYMAADNNERVYADIDLSGFTTSPTMAQRLAKIELLRRRQGLVITAPFKLSAYRAITGGTVGLTLARYGFSNKAFVVAGSRFVPGDEGQLVVELTLQETAAAIFDWSTSEEQSKDIAPNTNLPNPRSVGTPSVVSISEELYTTTGSTGVRTKAIFAWAPPPDALVVSYQVEYMRPGESAWNVLPRTAATAAEILDLSPGMHQFRVKGINVFGVSGPYVSSSREILGLLDPPADVEEFNITPLGARATLSWKLHSDLDVRIGGRILIRWSPSTSSPSWNDAVQVATVAGDARSVDVAHQSGTYLAKAQDSSGHDSDNAVRIVTTELDLLGYNAIETIAVSPDWIGTKDGVVVRDGELQLAAGVPIDSITDPIDSWGLIDSLGGYAAEGTIELDDASQIIDLGAIYTSRVTARLQTLSFRTDDLIDSWLEPIDSWGLIDGPEISDTQCDIFVATTEDDPAGAPVWSDWKPFVVGDYKARAFKFMVRLRSGNLEHNISVESLEISIDMPDREYGERNVASGAGTKSVTYLLSPVFKALPRIGVTAKNLATGDFYVISNEAVSGFDIIFKNSAGAAVNRNFDFQAKGY